MSHKKDSSSKKNFDSTKNNFESLYKRALADYHNLQKQTNKDKEELAHYIKGNLVMDFLPVYENLKAAMDHADKKNHDNWLTGINYVIKQFEEVLMNHGVHIINPTDENFNPVEHEAVQKISTTDSNKNNKIAKVIKQGYKIGSKVIKAARVEVYIKE